MHIQYYRQLIQARQQEYIIEIILVLPVVSVFVDGRVVSEWEYMC